MVHRAPICVGMLSAIAKIVAAVAGTEPVGTEAALRGRLLARRGDGDRLKIGRGVELIGRENIRLGNSVTLWGNSCLNATGQRGHIEIGDSTHLDQYCVLYGQGGLTIGSGCAIAAGVVIYSQSNQYKFDPTGPILGQPVIHAPVTIGDDVWIGARVVILPGVAVGSHAVIGAGAVVRHGVEAWSIVGGVPAKNIGQRK